MVRALLTVVAAVATRRVPIFELAGAAAVVVGVGMWSPAAGWAAAGVALLGKSFEWETKGKAGSG